MKKSFFALLFAALVCACGSTTTPSPSPSPSPTPTPSAPQNVSAAAGNAQATIQWNAVSDATSYNVYWANTAGVTTSSTKIQNASSPYAHTSLTNGTSYYYAVTAVNANGEGSLSSEVSATPQLPAPGVPSAVTITAGTSRNTISWNAVTSATSYNIYWANTAGVTTSSTKIQNASSPYAHTILTNGTTYHYAVTAVNAGGESALSSEVSGTPQPAAPDVPSNVSAAGGDGQTTVSWDAVTGATSYNIYWDNTSPVTTSDNKISGATSPYNHTSLTNGTTYYYAVAAVIGSEKSLSSEVSATPQVPAPSAPTGVSVSALYGGYSVSWDAVSGATSYNIYWSASSSVTKTTGTKITGVTSPNLITNVAGGTTRYFVVTAVNAGGESGESSVVNTSSNYRVFITSESGTGILGNWAKAGGQSGINAGDTICATLANDVNFTGTYKAWLSSSTNNAIDRITANGPWGLVYGNTNVADLEDLTDGSLDAAINMDEFGNGSISSSVYTGTQENGIKLGHDCTSWTASGTASATGLSNKIDTNWTNASTLVCSGSYRLYCFEQ